METIKNLTTVATLIAAIGAAIFFGWKLLTGWFVVNLEISIDTKRINRNAEEDFLSLTIQLKKGNTDTLQLKDVAVRIKSIADQTKIASFSFEELVKLKLGENDQLIWEEGEYDSKVSLSPGESFPLSRSLLVPSGKAILIEVAVFGNRAFWRKRGFQWRASASSLPEPKIEMPLSYTTHIRII